MIPSLRFNPRWRTRYPEQMALRWVIRWTWRDDLGQRWFSGMQPSPSPLTIEARTLRRVVYPSDSKP